MKACGFTLALGLLLFTAGVSPAQPAAEVEKQGRFGPAHRQRHRGPEISISRIREELNLDEQQQAEFDRIAEEFRSRRGGEHHSQMRELVDQMRSARREGDDVRAAEIRAQIRTLREQTSIRAFLDEIESILHDQQLETLNRLRQEARIERGPARGPLAQLHQLREELNLSPEQAEQYDQLYDELRGSLAQSEPSSAETGELIEQLREAVEAGDDQRVEELKEQLPDQRARAQELVTEFFDEVQTFLDPKQVETLRLFERNLQLGRRAADLRACFRFVGRLDLDKEQRRGLRELRRDARQAKQEARRSPDKLAEVTRRIQEQIRDLLTDEQVAEFDQWLAAQEAEKPSRQRGTHRHHRHRQRRQAEEPVTEGEQTP